MLIMDSFNLNFALGQLWHKSRLLEKFDDQFTATEGWLNVILAGNWPHFQWALIISGGVSTVRCLLFVCVANGCPRKWLHMSDVAWER